jgi:hypothetical protein
MPAANYSTFYRVLIFMGAALVIYSCAVDVPVGLKTRNWPATEATITAFKLITEDGAGPDGNQKRTFVRIDFAYNVKGQDFQGRWEPRKAFGMWGMPGSLRDSHPKGNALTIYYSPENPKSFAIQRGITWTTIGTIVAGIGLIAFGLYQSRKS